MKERKRYKVIDKRSGPIPLFTREYTIDDFPFLKKYFFSRLGFRMTEVLWYQNAWGNVNNFLYG